MMFHQKYYKHGKTGHRNHDCKMDRKESEKAEKAEKCFDEDKDDLIICTITEKSKPVQEKTKKYNLLLTLNPLLIIQLSCHQIKILE